MKFSLLAGLLLVVSSCTPPSLNVQRSALRSVGDLGVTVGLEFVAEKDVVALRKEIAEVAKKVVQFLDTGVVPNLTEAQINARLVSLVPPKYMSYFNTALTALSGRGIPIGQKIGSKNVRRIKAAVKGIQRGAEGYLKTDRNPPAP